MASPLPDILWVLTTQWRGQAAGFAGDPNASTPCLDALAREAAVFDQAFSNHPFGPFARALVLTGRPSPANGVADYWDPLPTGATTVAHRLADAGYATAFFGKWHLARRDRQAPVVGEAHARTIVPAGSRGGFEFWEGFEGGFLLNDPWLHGTRLTEPVQVCGYQSDVVVDRALAWLAGRPPAARRPLFLVVSVEAPHPPYAAAVPAGTPEVPPEAIQLPANVPRGGEVEATARRELAGYYRHIAATDRALGRLLGAFDPSRAAVFVTSVHGDMHGAHGFFRKGWPFEDSVRVPLLARGPGFVPGRVATPVSLADLPATALALTGPSVPDGWIGGDLRGVGREDERAILLGMPSVPPFAKQCPQAWRGVRTREELYAVDAAGRPWLHFDLRNDPGQIDNRVADPATASRREVLRTMLRNELQRAGDPFRVE